MNLNSTHDDGQDSDDLQALFDSVAASVAAPAPAADATSDSDELQALFDSVVATAKPTTPATPSADAATADSDELQALFDSVSQAGVARAVAPAPTPGTQ